MLTCPSPYAADCAQANPGAGREGFATRGWDNGTECEFNVSSFSHLINPLLEVRIGLHGWPMDGGFTSVSRSYRQRVLSHEVKKRRRVIHAP
jgi:hypothetical protein